MKYLLTLLVPIAACFAAPSGPSVPDCFKVHSLIRMDEDHYWANWTNACPYTIDSVYVMVKFGGGSTSGSVDGVWALHFVTPGTHQVTRFTTPMGMADYDSVRVSKITTDSEEALHVERLPQYLAARDPNLVADPGPAVLHVREAQPVVVSRIVEVSPMPGLATETVARKTVASKAVAAETVAPATPRVESASAAVHQRRGRELLNKRKYQEAIEELSEAIRQRPDYPLAYNARGFGYYLMRQYSRALADLDQAIRLNPHYLNAYQNRSRVKKAIGDPTGSTADGKKARELAHIPTE